MAKIADGVLVDWEDGQVIRAKEYKQERDILRTALNATDADLQQAKDIIQQIPTKISINTSAPPSPVMNELWANPVGGMRNYTGTKWAFIEPYNTTAVSVYVDPVNGDDANTGESWEKAFKTISAALNNSPKVVLANYMIYLAAGTFDMKTAYIDMINAGKHSQSLGTGYIWFRGQKDESGNPTTIFDGGGTAPYLIGMEHLKKVVVENIRFQNTSAYGISVSERSYLLSMNCRYVNCGTTSIIISNNSSGRFYGNQFSGTAQLHVEIYGGSSGTVGGAGPGNGNTFNDATDAAVYFANGSAGHCDYNTFTDNVRAVMCGSSSYVQVEGNIIHDCTDVGLWVRLQSTIYGVNNTFENNPTNIKRTEQGIYIDNLGAVQGEQKASVRAYPSAHQDLPAGAYTKLLFNTKDRDELNNFNTTTSEFTAPVDGWYVVGTSISLAGQVVGNRTILKVYRNGGDFELLGDVAAPAAGNNAIVASKPVYLTAGQKLTLYLYSVANITMLGSDQTLTNVEFVKL